MGQTTTPAPDAPVAAAPESHYQEQQSPKMDIFSFGVLLIEMCLNEFPSQDQLFEQHRSDGYVGQTWCSSLKGAPKSDLETNPAQVTSYPYWIGYSTLIDSTS